MINVELEESDVISLFVRNIKLYWKEMQVSYGIEDTNLYITNYAKYRILKGYELSITPRYYIKRSMVAKAVFSLNKNETPFVSIITDVLYPLMLRNIDKLDLVYEHYCLVLKHEIGHVLQYKQGCESHNNMRRYMKLRDDLITKKISEREFMETFFTTFEHERCANEIVGLNWEELYNSGSMLL